jgi:hypothetical protein
MSMNQTWSIREVEAVHRHLRGGRRIQRLECCCDGGLPHAGRSDDAQEGPPAVAWWDEPAEVMGWPFPTGTAVFALPPTPRDFLAACVMPEFSLEHPRRVLPPTVMGN